MKSQVPDDPRFDEALRALHQSAAAAVSPNTRARLRIARRSSPESPLTIRLRNRWPWLGASMASVLLLVAVGVHRGPEAGPESTKAPAPLAAAGAEDEFDSLYPTVLSALDEDPDLYVWLASDSQPLTLEHY